MGDLDKKHLDFIGLTKEFSMTALAQALVYCILMCVVCCKCCCGATEKKYYQILSYGIMMIVFFIVNGIKSTFPTHWGSFLYTDLALGLWMTILAIVKMCTLPSEDDEAGVYV